LAASAFLGTPYRDPEAGHHAVWRDDHPLADAISVTGGAVAEFT
jgi:hypothetical protein